MAQDAAAPPARNDNAGRWFGQLTGLVRRLDLLPSTPKLGPVAYNRALVAYVAVTLIAAVAVGAFTLRTLPHANEWPVTLAVAGVTIFLMALYAIRQAGPIQVGWTPTAYIHLGLAVAIGPFGALVGAVAEPLGVSVRNGNGWFRTSFNIANDFLANVTAYGAFTAVEALLGKGTAAELAAGLTAGLTLFALNSGFVAVVIHLADRSLPIGRVVRSRVSVFPYSIGYGLAAFAFVVMQRAYGTVGFMALLTPVILLHGYLIIFARRLDAFEKQRAEHQKEREELLQKAVEASEAERRRIARDLHDGVVQNLAGMAFALSAEASQLKAQASAGDGRNGLLELLETSATETRGAMKDLRTLIIELSPPTLRREGLQAALLEVLREIKRKGTNTELDLQPNLRLREDRGALIFRVAQEILRNVAAHAQAKNVKVHLTTEDGSAILSIEDDGKGFREKDVERRRAEGHLGTAAIVELAEDAGGTLTIDSEPGRGTLVVLTLPIE
jgi:signal transduction histidine kinase